MNIRSTALLAALAGALAAPAAHALVITDGGLSGTDPANNALTFEWTVTWDRRNGAAALNSDSWMPNPRYWTASVSIQDLDSDGTADDLSIQVQHFGLGPNTVEQPGHGDGEKYVFNLNNALANLPFNTAAQNIAGSIQEKNHPSATEPHEDDYRVEYTRLAISPLIVFTVQAVHSPVPEPGSALLLAGGMAWLALRRARR